MRTHFGKQAVRITWIPETSMEKNTVLSLKIAINLKSVKLKAEDTFHTIFIWLITFNHLNLLLRCHWRVVLFSFSLCLFFISFSSSFFPSLSSYSILTSLPILLPTLTACSSWEGANLSLQCSQKALLLFKVNTTCQLVC